MQENFEENLIKKIDELSGKVDYLQSRLSVVESAVKQGSGENKQTVAPIVSGQQKTMAGNMSEQEINSLYGIKPTGVSQVKKQPQNKSAEFEIGQKWFSVVGVVLLFLGILFLVTYMFKFFGPGGKVVLSYAVGGVLFGVAILTWKKYQQFAQIVAAGAWGVVYLATYAMYFFSATKIITSPALELFLLAFVVVSLLVFALFEKSRLFVALALILATLTTILSPLSLFSIIGSVIIVAGVVIIARFMPWEALLLPGTLGAYLSYIFWSIKVGGLLPGQGGGLFEKNFLGLICLIIIWALIVAGIIFSRGNEKSEIPNFNVITLLISSFATVFFGLAALNPLIASFERLGTGYYLFVICGLHAGLFLLFWGEQKARSLMVAVALFALVTGLFGLPFLFVENSSVVSFVWALIAWIIIWGAILVKRPRLVVYALLPVVFAVVRYVINDIGSNGMLDVIPTDVITGIIIAFLFVIGAILARGTRTAFVKTSNMLRVPAIILGAGLLVLFIMTQKEFSAAIPSILWGLIGLVVVLGGFMGKWGDARVLGLAALVITVVRVFVNDLANLDIVARIFSFMILGAILLGIGFAYNLNKDKLQHLLEE
ncbi:MAG: DUF2339 domain-containing protein [bacterium]|nr:DUF2339 domain-containing protein [bacterium]